MKSEDLCREIIERLPYVRPSITYFIKISSPNLQGMFMATKKTVCAKFWPHFEKKKWLP